MLGCDIGRGILHRLPFQKGREQARMAKAQEVESNQALQQQNAPGLAAGGIVRAEVVADVVGVAKTSDRERAQPASIDDRAEQESAPALNDRGRAAAALRGARRAVGEGRAGGTPGDRRLDLARRQRDHGRRA